jgi:hypothetical protein
MGSYKVSLRGHGLWVYVDDELEHLTFLVDRFVEAPDPEAAAQTALRLVREDRRTQSAEGYAAPVVSVDSATELASNAEMPNIQPGFRFYPATADR